MQAIQLMGRVPSGHIRGGPAIGSKVVKLSKEGGVGKQACRSESFPFPE